jgi:hypothetical protein
LRESSQFPAKGWKPDLIEASLNREKSEKREFHSEGFILAGFKFKMIVLWGI